MQGKLEFFVNGSAFFDCEHDISYDSKVRNCKSSEFGTIGGAFAESSKSFLSKGNKVPFLCRIGCFGYGSDKSVLGKGNSVPLLSQIGWFALLFGQRICFLRLLTLHFLRL